MHQGSSQEYDIKNDLKCRVSVEEFKTGRGVTVNSRVRTCKSVLECIALLLFFSLFFTAYFSEDNVELLAYPSSMGRLL